MKKNILILGKDGMLGSMVYDYFKRNSNFNVSGTTRQRKSQVHNFEIEKFIKNKRKYYWILKYDYIINCIGLIKPYCNDNDILSVSTAIKINALFPYELMIFITENKSKAKVISIATDCVFSGKKGKYNELDFHDAVDAYGKTKSLGEINSNNNLNIRCSIIGPELKNYLSLYEWFLKQKNTTVYGFKNHFWNGVTTLQFSKLCYLIIKNDMFTKLRNISSTYHFVPNNSVSKYTLLNLINNINGKKINLKEIKATKSINRTLSTKYPYLTNIYGKSSIKKELVILKEYIDTNNL